MQFANPIALWGFIGLIVPTIALLLSKRKQELVNFGSLEFLRESESKSARSIFPSQWLLYFLRVSILTLLVILLAKPVFKSDHPKQRVIIEKEVFEDPSFSTILRSLEEEPEVVEPSSWWLLIHSLNNSGDSAIVYSRSYQRDFVGRPLELESNINWVIIPNKESFTRKDTSIIEDQTILSTITSGEEGITWDNIETSASASQESINLRIESSQERMAEKSDLIKILESFSANLPLDFRLVNEAPDWMITIDTIVKEEVRRVIEYNSFIGPLSLHVISSDLYQMNGALESRELMNSDFLLELAGIFLGQDLHLHEMDRRVKSKLDQKVVSEANLMAGFKNQEHRWYWYVPLMVLLLSERWYSFKSREG